MELRSEGAATPVDESISEPQVTPTLPGKALTGVELQKAYPPAPAPSVAEQNAERAAALGGSSAVFILGGQDKGPAIPPCSDSVVESGRTDVAPPSERRALLEAAKARRAARRVEDETESSPTEKIHEAPCPTAGALHHPSASVATDHGERSAAKNHLDRIRSNRTEREHDRELLAKLEEHDEEAYRNWRAAAEAKIREPPQVITAVRDRNGKASHESTAENAELFAMLEDEDDADAPIVEQGQAGAPLLPAAVPTPSPELLTGATPRAIPRDVRLTPKAILTDQAAESHTASTAEMSVAQSNRKAVMEQVKLKRAARRRDDTDYDEDEGTMPPQCSEQRSNFVRYIQMQLYCMQQHKQSLSTKI